MTALLAADPGAGDRGLRRNQALLAQLRARGEAPARLRAVGWTDDMPGWMTAADLVVANGGGAAALEAVASSRPVIMFDPIAGHGRANAALMASAGLAWLAGSPAALTGTVRELASDPAACARQAGAALAGAGPRLDDDLARLVALRSP